ncbi:MAG TPA: peptidylprolyl isomerase [Cyclobacteriaceae bacterium]|nr:peptidylprolyl isomerase [Cyclobacteriaceae bacterium]HRJ83439.1 peptidylprolyl isomerase [Cyclobacteriaceae bacterium]
MQIAKNTVVSIHYTLRDDQGNVLDSSEGKDPLLYIQGIGNLIPGMEEGLEGKLKGDKLDIKVTPEKGYGTRNDSLIQKVPRTAFGDQEVRPGMQFQAQTSNGAQIVTITEVGLESVTVDGNHPLAGVGLNFAVEVMDVRQATEDELSHGHVHGPGGHHH